MFSRLSCLVKNVPQRSYNFLRYYDGSRCKKFSSMVSCPDVITPSGDIEDGDDADRYDNPVKDGNSINYKDVEIFDVNAENMMGEDTTKPEGIIIPDIEPDMQPEPAKETISAMDRDGAPLAPIDIDPWVDELQATEGTVDFDIVADREKFVYPEPPKDRPGLYVFDGIKIWLPKRFLTMSTYRYCLDPEDKRLGVDDIRICKFEKTATEAKTTCPN